MPPGCCKETWAKIPDDEPVFILRAKDKLAAEVINYWIELAKRNGVNPNKISRSYQHLAAFMIFKEDYPERVKIPD